MAGSKIECRSTGALKCTAKAFTTSNGARTINGAGNSSPTAPLVLKHARLKALELEAKKAGITVEADAIVGSVVPSSLASSVAISSGAELPPIQIDGIPHAAGLLAPLFSAVSNPICRKSSTLLSDHNCKALASL